MPQKYVYVPGFEAVNVNFSSVSITFDLKLLSSLMTLCGMSSLFTHVTSVPTLTWSSAGVNVKLSIFTSTTAGFGSSMFAETASVMVARETIVRTENAAIGFFMAISF